MQGQLRRLYVPCPPLSSTFSPVFSGPFHVGLGRRFEQHALGAIGPVEMIKFTCLPARHHLLVLSMTDFPRPDDALLAALKVIAVGHRQRRQRPPQIAYRPQFPDLGRRKMRALAIEIVMGRKAGLGPPAMLRWARRQRLIAPPVMLGEARPGVLGEIGPRCFSRRIAPPTDVFGIGWMFHGGARGVLEEEGGGDVPALASSLHMLEDVEFRMVAHSSPIALTSNPSL